MKHSRIYFITILPESYVFGVFFLYFLGVFYAFSAPEFTLVFSIPRLLTVWFITVFLSSIPPSKEVATMAAAYHDTFRTVIRLSLIFQGEVF